VSFGALLTGGTGGEGRDNHAVSHPALAMPKAMAPNDPNDSDGGGSQVVGEQAVSPNSARLRRGAQKPKVF
jgi:hypothetical protein